MSKNDPFAMYKMPAGLTEGVRIPLAGTSAVFTVVLPGMMNETFSMELMSRVNGEPDDEGNIKIDAKEFQKARRVTFFETCIKSAKGLPKGMTHEEFFDTYAIAARSVFDRAEKLAKIADEAVNDALGKSESLPNGKSSGRASMTTTTSSSKAA